MTIFGSMFITVGRAYVITWREGKRIVLHLILYNFCISTPFYEIWIDDLCDLIDGWMRQSMIRSNTRYLCGVESVHNRTTCITTLKRSLSIPLHNIFYTIKVKILMAYYIPTWSDDQHHFKGNSFHHVLLNVCFTMAYHVTRGLLSMLRATCSYSCWWKHQCFTLLFSFLLRYGRGGIFIQQSWPLH